MKKTVTNALFAGIFMLSLPLFSFASSRTDYGDWWVKMFGALSSADHPLVSRTQEVFDRVLAAADKRSSRYPKLVIIRKVSEPWAIALKDGTVILTRKGMEICYQAEDKSIGDSLLAFVLGHELAHLTMDDFWHVAAFEAVQQFGSGKKTCNEILELIKTENNAETGEVIRKKELQADSYGLLYAAMGGYDPKVIVEPGGKNFFQEWVNQVTGKMAYDKFHPTPDQRSDFLLLNMKAVIDDIGIFDIGVRLFQLGKYEDALEFLAAFREKFPCREVFNNIGLIHYQLAVETLARCSRKKAYQYKLSAMPDTETRAGIFIPDALRKEQCENKDVFQRKIQDAIRYFRYACEKDRFYVPGRVNLSSALIMTGRYSGAMDVLDKALELKQGDPGALNNRAVAMYLLGPSINVDMFQQAVDVLRDLLQKDKEFSDACYNLGSILAERGRNAAAKKIWERYLTIESSGVYAEMVRDALGIRKAPVEKLPDGSSDFRKPSPVILGEVNKETRKLLSKFDRHDLELGTVYGAYYCGEDIRILVLENSVELVEKSVKQKMSLSEVNSVYGRPLRISTSHSGSKTFVYNGFALDIHDGMTTKVIYFEKGFFQQKRR